MPKRQKIPAMKRKTQHPKHRPHGKGPTPVQTQQRTAMQTSTQSLQTVQTITPELRQWIVEQAQAGCHPNDVLAAMKTSGWQEEVAVAAMEQTLSEHLQAVKAAKDAAAAAAGSGPGAQGAGAETAGTAAGGHPVSVSAGAGAGAGATQSSALPPASVVPQVLPLGPCSRWQLPDGHTVYQLSALRHPRVLVLGGFLSDEECDALMALAAPRLARSETVDNGTGGSEVNAARTSDGMFFERGETPVIQRIEQRIADLLNWPVSHGEGLQVLRYRPGAEYKPHHDYFDPAHAGSKTILARGGQRVATLVMYLNTPTEGGATTFPDVGLDVMPVRGNAVFFSYDRPHPCTATLHGGAPVLAGEKWVATKWLRQDVFV
jgi:prolyl 4-hydroxylase